MKRLLYDVSRWHLYLHREGRALRPAEPTDSPVQQLEDELFDSLYGGEQTALPEADTRKPTADWARGLHSALEALPSFERLQQQCRGRAAAAAAAVDSLMAELGPVAPPEQPLPPGPALRRAGGKACTAALAAVEDLEEGMEGLQHVAFGAGTGKAALPSGDAAAYTHLAAQLRTTPMLRELSRLAGRFKRILAAKRRSRVRHGADEVADIEQGDALPRLLPSELARLHHPLRRLALLRDLVERRCLQYRLAGAEPLGKGPLVVCLDKSGSMSGEKNLWATAVALALLETAAAERRPFGLLSFTVGIAHESLVLPGGALPSEALFVGCAGGTDIDVAVERAFKLIASTPSMGKADVVLVSDGASTPERAAELRAMAADRGASILGVAIHMPPSSLEPWCDQTVAVDSLTGLDGPVADALSNL